MQPKIHITSLWNAPIFADEMLVFHEALKTAGYNVTYMPYQLEHDAVNIVFGAIAITAETLKQQAPRAIIRNSEHVTPDGPCMCPRYIEVLKQNHVWDYCANDLPRLAQAGVLSAEYLPVCYDKALEVVPVEPEQDIDVYFYGNLTPRRAAVIDALRARGLHVVVSNLSAGDAYGEERNALIARAKVVLNVGLVDSTHRVFEMVRVSLLLANRKAVVAEVGENTDIEPDILEAVAAGTIDVLPDLCVALVQDEARRTALAEKGYEIFSRRQASEILGVALSRYLHGLPVPQCTIPIPRTIHLEAISASSWRYDCLNISCDTNTRADLHIDIGKPLHFGQSYPSWRFGEVVLEHGMVDVIVAHHVFQRVDDLPLALTNCLNLLSEGGSLEIVVPHDLAASAWCSVGTKRAFNEMTFGFSRQQCMEFGWREYCFESAGLIYSLGARGGALLNQHHGNIDALKSEVRAFEYMTIRLVKRRMTWSDQDLYQHHAYYWQ